MKKYSIILLAAIFAMLLLNPLSKPVEAKATTKAQFAKDIKKTILNAETKTRDTIYRSEITPGKHKPFSKIEPTLKKYYTSKYIKKWKTVYNKVGSNLYVLSEPSFPYFDHHYSYESLRLAKVNYDRAFRVKSLTASKATVEFDIPPALTDIGDSMSGYIAQYKLIKKSGKWLLDEKTWKYQKDAKFKKFVTDKNLSKIVLKQVNIKGTEVKLYSYNKGIYHVKLGQKGQQYGYFFEDVNAYTGSIIENMDY
ncbi:hypothetical protein QR721_12870 [Aciduricibacillus chroicocephali]|uniref:Uncharacterized protein n=1 Tax=Aciduricibacillus chroicocephali TaxID=3054939 RepID=A0ABY9KXU2_9BACI|nr:hypothetical protein QR721_12870 [Bacillaceae bacterium 44XB]